MSGVSTGKIYLCELSENDDIRWRRLCTEDDLSAYYSKTEFDEKYAQHIGTVSALVDNRLFEYSEDFKNRFLTKADADEFITLSREKIAEYSNSLNDLQAWRAVQQAKVDAYEHDVMALSSLVQDLSNSQNAYLSSWIEEQENLINERLSILDEKQKTLEDRISDSEHYLHEVSTEVAILSGALDAIRKGSQKVLGERYEA